MKIRCDSSCTFIRGLPSEEVWESTEVGLRPDYVEKWIEYTSKGTRTRNIVQTGRFETRSGGLVEMISFQVLQVYYYTHVDSLKQLVAFLEAYPRWYTYPRDGTLWFGQCDG